MSITCANAEMTTSNMASFLSIKPRLPSHGMQFLVFTDESCSTCSKCGLNPVDDAVTSLCQRCSTQPASAQPKERTISRRNDVISTAPLDGYLGTPIKSNGLLHPSSLQNRTRERTEFDNRMNLFKRDLPAHYGTSPLHPVHLQGRPMMPGYYQHQTWTMNQ